MFNYLCYSGILDDVKEKLVADATAQTLEFSYQAADRKKRAETSVTANGEVEAKDVEVGCEDGYEALDAQCSKSQPLAAQSDIIICVLVSWP